MRSAVAREIIPWHVFFESMTKQPTARLEGWLAKWYFDDNGAFINLYPKDDLLSKAENTVLELIALKFKKRPASSLIGAAPCRTTLFLKPSRLG